MAIITRPVKPVGGGGGTSFIAGPDIIADEVNGDVDTIYTDYDGNITNANIAAAAGIQGTKLADAPNGVPATKINDAAVETAKIKDVAVTKAKIAAANISLDKMLITVHPVTFTNIPSSVRTAVNPTISFAKATYELIGLYVMNITPVNALITFWADNSGVNWAGYITPTPGGWGGTASGVLVYVFIQKI